MNRTERTELFEHCATALRPMLWRLAGGYASEAYREDLLQEMLLQIWRALPRFKARAALSTWAYRVGLYTAMNWARRQPAVEQESLELHSEPAGITADPALQDELARALEIIRHELGELDRAVLLLALEGVSRVEMGEILGLSTSAVTTRLSRARDRLEAQLYSTTKNQ